MTVEEERFFKTYPELHHYTSWDSLQGMFTVNTFWATHYEYLNDRTEIVHMKEYLTRLISRNRDERRRAKKEIDSLYHKKTFPRFLTPYIVSFSTHAAGTDFDRDNGSVDQWMKYGRHGYAVVLDTKRLNDLINMEFETYCYTQTIFANVVYNLGIDHFKASFGPLIEEARWFIFNETVKEYSRTEQFVSDFIKTTASFKHSDWRSECEVRIIACPVYPANLKCISDGDPDDIKALRSRRIKQIHLEENVFHS